MADSRMVGHAVRRRMGAPANVHGPLPYPSQSGDTLDESTRSLWNNRGNLNADQRTNLSSYIGSVRKPMPSHRYVDRGVERRYMGEADAPPKQPTTYDEYAKDRMKELRQRGGR